jgi:hypothetical protein
LVAVAIAISYFDRLTLPVAVAAIQHNIYSGWRAVFLAAGCAGLAWSLWWTLSYRPNPAASQVGGQSISTAPRPMRWADVIRLPNVQAWPSSHSRPGRDW